MLRTLVCRVPTLAYSRPTFESLVRKDNDGQLTEEEVKQAS